MTRKLYEEDSHLTTFQAEVLACRKEKEKYLILLNQTAFFPEGGGQGGDTGYLDHVRVTDTQEGKEGIWHMTEASSAFGKNRKGED